MTTATLNQVDVLIVGAGPVGLFGAYYAGVRTLSTAVLDSLEEPGGQITAMYPEKAIFDVAGFPADQGPRPRRSAAQAGGTVQPALHARAPGRRASSAVTAGSP